MVKKEKINRQASDASKDRSNCHALDNTNSGTLQNRDQSETINLSPDRTFRNGESNVGREILNEDGKVGCRLRNIHDNKRVSK